ncbi:MAG TPA: hypothetical protein DD459_11940, partial [Halieaceae bacterium]|nr:hypothetical protein [Halieaceae bacterium]
PQVIYDLPAGGRRVYQGATGYRYTLVSGEVIMQDGAPTGALPGRLVRACKQGDSHLPNTPQPHSKEEAA